jgi:hypothetical protein
MKSKFVQILEVAAIGRKKALREGASMKEPGDADL